MEFNIYQGNNTASPERLKQLPDKPPPWRDFTIRPKERGQTYKAGEKEIEMINAALLLRRPLLIEGAPGVGKSSLAYAVAYELGLGDVEVWPITSKSQLQDGLYRYDAIARLHEASIVKQMVEGDKNGDGANGTKLSNLARFIRLGPLGAAFLRSKSQKPAVLLIDEIDKSDYDMPNDLLHLFEEGEFEIPEIGRHPEAKKESKISISGA